MNKQRRRFRLRTVLLTAVTAALIASSAAFAAVNASNSISPSDVSPTDSSASTVVSPGDTSVLPENLGDPVVVMTTEMPQYESFELGIVGTDVWVHWGGGQAVEYGSLGSSSPELSPETVRSEPKGSTIRIYGHIEALTCRNDRLTSLDVSACTSLRSLDCGLNMIDTLRLPATASLETLNCENCRLTSLGLLNLPSLKELYCNANRLTSLDMSGNPALEKLICYDNQLTAINLEHNTSLRETMLSNNRLTSLDLSHNTALVSLNCDNNRLTSLDVSHNPNLFWLQCGYNRMPLSALSRIDCDAIHSRTDGFGNFGQVNYIPQTVTIPAVVEQGQSIDLSSEYSINGTLTEFVWYDESCHIMTPATSEGGVFTFGRDAEGLTLFCVMTNAEVPDAVYNPEDYPYFYSGVSSSKVKIKPQGLDVPAVVMTTGLPVGDEMYLGIDGSDIFIDRGDGVPEFYGGLGCDIGTHSIGVTLQAQTIRIYGNINMLDCSMANLTSLDVSECAGLQQLNCANNELTSLDVTRNAVLTYLDCSNNGLTRLSTSGNAALSTLKAYSNKLTALDLSRNAALTDLDCSDNALKKLDVTRNTALTSLTCNCNALTALNVSANTALENLVCTQNKLTALDLSHNSLLTELECAVNAIGRLDLTYNASLTDIMCGENRLTSLDLSHNPALVYLECSSNQLTALDLSRNTALTYVECYGNSLASLDLSHNPDLTGVWCDYNPLTSLDMSHNPALQSLQCSDCKLASLNIAGCGALETLFCGNNRLASLDVSGHPDLIWIQCDGNELTSLDVSGNPSLVTLSCQHNRISTLSIHNNLSDLFCTDNRLSLPFVRSLLTDYPELTLYSFAPQTHAIPATAVYGESIDLSSEYSVNGTESEFTWYDSYGNVVLPATSENGVFTFGEDAVGKTLVCKIRNSELPDFMENAQVYVDYDPELDESIYEIRDQRLTTTPVRIVDGEWDCLTVKAGTSRSLKGLLDDVTGTVQWSSSNRAAVTVDAKGVIKAVAEGSAVVKARCGGYLKSFMIEVEKAVALSKYQLSFTRTTANPSPIATLTAKKPAGVKNVVWYSDHPEVATVSDRGAVKAVGAGTANIYCEDAEGGSVSAPCAVTVEDFIITSATEIADGQAFVLTGHALRFTLDNANHGAISWKSSSSSVASVDGEGNVTAAKPGTVTLTATAADKKASDSIKLTVIKPTESIAVTGMPQNFYVGGTAQLKAALSKGSNDKIFWSTADDSIVTVDASGKIKAIAKGETTVTATAFGGASQSVSVTVRTKAESVSWTTVQPDMSISKSVKFGVALNGTLALAIRIDAPADCNDSVKWTSSKPNVAAVEPSADGRSATVTGKAGGTAVITAKTGSGKALTATVSVVTVPATGLTLNRDSVSLYVGSGVALSAALTPKGCNDAVIWSSSDPSVATVNESGSVKAVSAGVATVTARSSVDGEIKATALVTVRTKANKIEWKNDVSGGTVSKEFRTGMLIDETRNLSVVITTPAQCNDTVTWATGNAKIVTVEPDGTGKTAVVTARGSGTAVITVKTGSGKKLTAKITVVSVPATSLTIDNKNVSVYVGGSVKLSAQTQAKTCDDVIRWSSDNPSVATVDENGTLRGIQQGTATVTAYSAVNGAVKDTADVVVRTKAKALTWGTEPWMTLSKEYRVYLSLSETRGMAVQMIAASEDEICNDTLTWSSSNSKVVTVTPVWDDGSAVRITGVAKGTAVITVKSGSGKKLTARITVGTTPASAITVSSKSVWVHEGSKVSVSAAVQPAGCDDVVLWQTDEPSVATVDENGVIKGLRQGTATVTAYSAFNGLVKDTVDVVVCTKAKALTWGTEPWMTISKEYRVYLSLSETRGMAAQMIAASEDEICNDILTWSSSNSKVVTVTPVWDDGSAVRITGVAKGTAVITVKSGSGKKLTARIIVGTTPATEVTVGKNKTTVYEKATLKLPLSIQPADCDDVIKWKTDEPGIATVDENGTVKGISQGTATITAYSSVNGIIQDSVEITVVSKATALKLDATDANLAVGEQQTVYAVLSPDGCNDTLTWSSSNSNVASVEPSSDGRSAVIRAKTKGSAVVTVKTGSGKKATVKVVVVG